MGLITNVFASGGVINTISVVLQSTTLERFVSFNQGLGEVTFNSINDGLPHVYIVTITAQDGQQVIYAISLTCGSTPTAPVTPAPVTPTTPASPVAPTPITPAPVTPTAPVTPIAPSSTGGFIVVVSSSYCDDYYQIISCSTGFAFYTTTPIALVNQLFVDLSGNFYTFSGVVVNGIQPGNLVSNLTEIQGAFSCPNINPVTPTVTPITPIAGPPSCISNWITNPAFPNDYCVGNDLVRNEIDGCGGQRETIITPNAANIWVPFGIPYCVGADQWTAQINGCGVIGNNILLQANSPSCCMGTGTIQYTGQNPIQASTSGGTAFMTAITSGLSGVLSYNWTVSHLSGIPLVLIAVDPAIFIPNDVRIIFGNSGTGTLVIRVTCVITSSTGCSITINRDFQVVVTN